MSLKIKIEAGWWFHGQQTGDLNLSVPTFFSSCMQEAYGYAGSGGRLFKVWVPELMVFDSANVGAVAELSSGRPIYDPYSGEEFATAEDFLDSCSNDTWEAMEALGLPPVALVYEGGVRNLYIRSPDSVLSASSVFECDGEEQTLGMCI